MNFTAEEIKAFDQCLFEASCYEIWGIILLGALVLFLTLVLLFLPDKYLNEKRYPGLDEKPKRSRYRNGKKLSRAELAEERSIQRKKRKRKNKIFRICAALCLLCLGIFLIIVANHQIDDLQLDMEKDAYVAYEGAFTCEYHHSKHGSYYTFTITDTEGKTVTLQGDNSDFYGMDEGNYYGRLVYGQNSEYLIELKLNISTNRRRWSHYRRRLLRLF